jgi:endonuclease YncB( thermonuclease family)
MIRFPKIVHLLTLFFVVIPSIALAGQYKVVRVVDGDTIVIKYGGKYEKVRLLCVKCMSSKDFEYIAGIKSG